MSDIIEGEVREVEPERAIAVVPAQPGQALVSAGKDGPENMIANASRLAAALRDIVEQQKLYATISGKKYPQVEAWSTIGRMDNVVARESAKPIRQDDGSYEAEVELIRLSDGMVIGRASAICGMPDDRPWNTRAEYARRSMAVTRATSRAFRQQYSWIMALAGYEPTPSDEMPGVPDAPNVDWIWLAGFIDGEGSIGIYEEKDPRKGPDYSHPRAGLQIVNTHAESIARCRAIVGSGDARQVDDGDANHKPLHRLHIRRHEVLERVLAATLPYLTTRRRQAELCLEFVRSRQAAEGRGRYAEFTERERAIMAELKPLNAVGPVPTAEDDEPDRPARTETTHDDGLVGTAEVGKGDADFELRQTPNGWAVAFRLVQGRKGYKVIAFGPLAEQLAALRASIEGQRITVWGTLHDETFRPKDATRDVTYQVVHAERIVTPAGSLPAPATATETPAEPTEAPSEPLPFDMAAVDAETLDPEERLLIAGGLP